MYACNRTTHLLNIQGHYNDGYSFYDSFLSVDFHRDIDSHQSMIVGQGTVLLALLDLPPHWL